MRRQRSAAERWGLPSRPRFLRRRRISSRGCTRDASGRVQATATSRARSAATRRRSATDVPALGGKRLSDVHRRDVQRLADDLLAERRDPSTIRNALMPFARDLPPRRAGRRRRDQPVHEPPAPSGQRPPRANRLARGGAATVGHAAGARPPDLGDRALRRPPPRRADGAPLGGRRPRRRRDPRRTLYDEKGRVEIEPKSRAGHRTVPIVGALRDVLVAHKARQDRHEGLVFGSTPTTPFQPSNLWRRAQTAW